MKKVLSIVLTLTMITAMFAGCGKKATEKPEATPVPTKAADATATTAPTQEPEATPDISEPVTLTWYLCGSTVTDDSDVLAKANEYLKEKLNVTLKPIWGTWGDYDPNSVLAINGGDDVDMYFTSSWSAAEYNAFARNGAWVRLDNPDNNLVEKYGSDLWEILPSVLTTGVTVDGKDGFGVYGVPAYKDCATQNCWDVNVTLLEKYGYTLDDIKNAGYFGFGDIFAKVKAGEGADFYPLLVEGMVLERMVTNTIMVTGDSAALNVLSYYLDPTDVTKVSSYGNKLYNKFSTDAYQKFVEKTREYFNAGYIDPAMGNANQANDARTAAQDAGKYLIGTQSYALGYEVEASARRGIEVQFVPTTDAYVDTTASQGAIFAISTAC